MKQFDLKDVPTSQCGSGFMFVGPNIRNQRAPGRFGPSAAGWARVASSRWAIGSALGSWRAAPGPGPVPPRQLDQQQKIRSPMVTVEPLNQKG